MIKKNVDTKGVFIIVCWIKRLHCLRVTCDLRERSGGRKSFGRKVVRWRDVKVIWFARVLLVFPETKNKVEFLERRTTKQKLVGRLTFGITQASRKSRQVSALCETVLRSHLFPTSHAEKFAPANFSLSL